ncbi:MAG: hypothetical protein ACK4RG_05240 [Fimbriimonadales bacterium]
MRYATVIGLSFALLMASSEAQQGSGRFSGYVFGDYYLVSQHHDPSIRGMSGFWFRRVYFTYDQQTTDQTAIRFRFEMNSPGDFKKEDSLNPYIKDAYVQYTAGKTHYLLGIIPTPTWEGVEAMLGYRPYEKTPVDLWRMGNSRDSGLGIKTAFGKTQLYFVVGNGSHTRSETNRGKAAYLSLLYPINEQWSFEVYGDIYDRPADSDWRTLQGFLAYRTDRTKVGLQYVHQDRQNQRDLAVFSVYAETQVTKRTRLFARADWVNNPVPDADKISYFVLANNARPTFYQLGVIYEVVKDFYLAPNVEWVTYANPPGGGAKPKDVLLLKTTFYYVWR